MANCATKHTAQFGILNRVPQATLVVGWIQGLCLQQTIPQLPADYVRDTGLLQLPVSPNPGASAYWNDLCVDKGIKIAVTDGSIAVKARLPNGTEHDIRQTIDPSPPGQFKPYYLFELNAVPLSVNSDGKIEEQYTLTALKDEPFLEDH